MFTLPKHIYGRQDTISEMQFIIERCAALYNSVSRRSHSGANAFGSGDIQIDVTAENHAMNTILTTNNESYDMESNSQCSTGGVGGSSGHGAVGLDGSDMSSVNSQMFVNNGKVATTIVGVYGPGGIGTLLFQDHFLTLFIKIPAVLIVSYPYT